MSVSESRGIDAGVGGVPARPAARSRGRCDRAPCGAQAPAPEFVLDPREALITEDERFGVEGDLPDAGVAAACPPDPQLAAEVDATESYQLRQLPVRGG